MVGSLKLVTIKCFKCSSGLQMPDGNCWCGIDMKPHNECPYNFEPGLHKLYKPEPKVVTPKQEARKIKVKGIKPKPVKPKSPTKVAKTKPTEQRKLF